MTTPVNFPIAKLLKEKEYKDKNMLGTVRLSEPEYYDPNGIIHSIKDAFEENDYKIEDCFNAPTIVSVVMWLYEKHGLWVEVIIEQPFYFGYDVFKVKNNVSQIKKFISYNSPTEAYEAAIEYTLNNLI